MQLETSNKIKEIFTQNVCIHSDICTVCTSLSSSDKIWIILGQCPEGSLAMYGSKERGSQKPLAHAMHPAQLYKCNMHLHWPTLIDAHNAMHPAQVYKCNMRLHWPTLRDAHNAMHLAQMYKCNMRFHWPTLRNAHSAMHCIKVTFYRTQVSWSDLCVWLSLSKVCKLNWCDSSWWRYQLNTNWWCQ